MALLKLLAILGRGDQASSEGMYEVLVDVMRRADTGINVGYALVYEAVNAVTAIYPNPLLLDAAATAISRFIRSDSHNLKYIGIKGLAIIVKDYPKYAADHQLAVIDCLEDRDETLKRKTLDLLFRMTNSVNVEFIVEKLLLFLKSASDDYFRTDLVSQITQCAERYAPSNAWYVQTVVRVFESAGDKVKSSVAQTLLQLIAEGHDDDEDEEEDDPTTELRTGAVEDFLSLSEKPDLPDVLAQSIAWVLGEYGYLSTSHSKEMIIDKLCSIVYKSPNSTTKVYQINAIMKLVAQVGSCPATVLAMISHYKTSISIEVAQRCNEFSSLLAASGTMAEVLPVDASCEDIDVDVDLSFLNWYVDSKLRDGCPPYNPPSTFDDDDDVSKGGSTGFKYTPYEKVTAPSNAPSMGLIAVPNPGTNTSTMVTLNSVPISALGSSGIAAGATSGGVLGVAGAGNNLLTSKGSSQVWGRQMLQPETQPVVSPPPVPAPALHPEVTTAPPIPAPEPAVAPVQVFEATAFERPRELTEKEKMAAALFGGVSSSSSSSSSSAKPKRASFGAGGKAGAWSASGSMATTPVNTVAATAVTMSSATTNTLLDTDDGPAGPVDVAAAAEIKSSGGFDLLGDLSMEVAPPVPPPIPQVLPASAMGEGGSILDLDFLDAAPAVSPVAFDNVAPAPRPMPAPAANSSQYNISDAFAEMSMGAGGNTALASLASSSGSRPLALTTNEFGSRWAKTPTESKLFALCRVRTLEQLRGAVPPSFAHVESITQSNEAIFAATSLTGATVLLHVKLSASRGGADVTVKSATKEICGVELQCILAALGSN